MTPNQLWPAVLDELKLQMTQATFDTWLKPTTGKTNGDTLTITVKTRYAQDWLENRLSHVIQRTIARLHKRPLKLQFQVTQAQGPPRSPEPKPDPIDHDMAPEPNLIDRDMAPDCRFAVEVINFDPTTAGWVMTSNYAWQFWQPYLGAIPFNLWNTLRSFPAAWSSRGKPLWPSIQTLADMCANHNRHKITGRAEYGQGQHRRKRMVGALEILENERIVWPRTYGIGTETIYYFRTLDHLPLLSPVQITKLTTRLQERHARQIARCQIDYDEWQQLTLPTFLSDDLNLLMSRT